MLTDTYNEGRLYVSREVRVKAKLTVSVEERLVERGKSYAASRRTSLSGIIEEALRRLAGSGQPTFARRWYGRFRLRSRPGNPRMGYLVKRYGRR
jgi:hypothetical protein